MSHSTAKVNGLTVEDRNGVIYINGQKMGEEIKIQPSWLSIIVNAITWTIVGLMIGVMI